MRKTARRAILWMMLDYMFGAACCLALCFFLITIGTLLIKAVNP